MANTNTHTQCVPRDTQDGWSLGEGSDVILTHVGQAAPIIKLMGYEHREIAVGGGRAGNGKHTHTHTQSVPRDTQDRWSLGQGADASLTHVSMARPLIKLLGYENLENAACGLGRRQWRTNTNIHTHTHTHTHTVSPVIHRVVEPRAMIRCNHYTCKRGPTLIKLVAYEDQEDAVGGGGNKQWQTHTHTVSS